ncbi:MAG: glycyl-radical enzyme activating protein [Thermoleophilia bacterium]|nr:glycyl-radical enzyme activating protein [Thermoleophilia bacterium]
MVAPETKMQTGRDASSQVKGLVFQIIHGSFVDGPGIRTTVFLKGCPLSCLWCCNPEGQKTHAELKVTAALCNQCGNCIPVCPEGAIRLGERLGEDPIVVDRTRCTNCLECVDVCYTGALESFGVCYTVDELFELVRKDERYYSDSGGGVTIGGGEPTLQASFVRAFLKKCREHYIHAALDTCGYTTSEEGVLALQEADLLLFDIKGLDSAQHFVDTAVYNDVILENLRRASDMGKPVIIRFPIIPGHTDSEENIGAVGAFLSNLRSVQRVDLMAYHQYGTVKYGQLGKEYRLQAESPGDERMAEIKERLEGFGLRVQLGG